MCAEVKLEQQQQQQLVLCTFCYEKAQSITATGSSNSCCIYPVWLKGDPPGFAHLLRHVMTFVPHISTTNPEDRTAEENRLLAVSTDMHRRLKQIQTFVEEPVTDPILRIRKVKVDPMAAYRRLVGTWAYDDEGNAMPVYHKLTRMDEWFENDNDIIIEDNEEVEKAVFGGDNDSISA